MTDGLTIKNYSYQVTYDIHLDGTCCSGFSNHEKGEKVAIFNVFKYFTEERAEYWSKRLYKEYSVGHKVIAPMFLVEWVDD